MNFVLGTIAWFNTSGIFTFLFFFHCTKIKLSQTQLKQEGHDGPGPLT